VVVRSLPMQARLKGLAKKELLQLLRGRQLVIFFLAQLVLATASLALAARQWQREAESAVLVRETNQRRLAGLTDWGALEKAGVILPPPVAAGRFLVAARSWPGFLVTGVELPSAMGGAAGEDFAPPAKVLLLFCSLTALLLSFDAISGEKAQRTLGLLLSVTGSRRELLQVKFLVRAAVVVGAVVISQLLAAAVTSLLVPEFTGDPTFWGVFLGLMVFCAAVSLLFVAVGFAASCLFPEPLVSLLAAIGAWVLLVIALPGFGEGVARALVPPPSRNLFEAQAASLYARNAQRMAEAIAEPLRRWVQEGPALQRWFEEEANRIRRELRGELARELAALFAGQLRAEARAAAARDWAVGWLPTGLYEQAMLRLGGADAASWRSYLQAVVDYGQVLAKTVEKKAGSVQYVAVQEEDPYSHSRPRLEEIPSFSAPPLFQDLASQLPRLVAICLWGCFFSVVAVMAFKRVDPR